MVKYKWITGTMEISITKKKTTIGFLKIRDVAPFKRHYLKDYCTIIFPNITGSENTYT